PSLMQHPAVFISAPRCVLQLHGSLELAAILGGFSLCKLCMSSVGEGEWCVGEWSLRRASSGTGLELRDGGMEGRSEGELSASAMASLCASVSPSLCRSVRSTSASDSAHSRLPRAAAS